MDLAQFRELEAFAAFGSDLDAATQRQLARGERTVEMLKQGQYQPMPVENQVAVIYAVTNGHIDHVQVSYVGRWERGFHEFLGTQRVDLLTGIRDGKQLTEEIEASLKEAISEFNEAFVAEHGADAMVEAAGATA